MQLRENVRNWVSRTKFIFVEWWTSATQLECMVAVALAPILILFVVFGRVRRMESRTRPPNLDGFVQDTLQVADHLHLLMQTGLSPLVALDAFIQDPPRISHCTLTTLNEVVRRMATGESLPVIIGSLAQNVVSPQNPFLGVLLTVLGVGDQTGAGVGDALERLRERLTAMQELHRRVRVWSAQMRLQARIIVLSPLALTLVLAVVRPKSIGFFVSQPAGQVLAVALVVANLTASLWIRRMLGRAGL